MKKMGVISRKGISAVVAVVLLLLIVVAAIVILWSVVIPLVKTNVQQVSSISEMTDFSIVEGGYTAYFPEKERAIVQIKSGPDNSTAVELQVMFYINGESVEYRIPPPKRDDTLPMSNEARVYWFNLSGMGVPEKVSVAPVYLRGNSLVVGNIISMVSLPSKNLLLKQEETQKLEDNVVSSGGGGGNGGPGDGGPGDVDPCANGACNIVYYNDSELRAAINIPGNRIKLSKGIYLVDPSASGDGPLIPATNVTIEGSGWDTIIKVKDRIGNFTSLFGYLWPTTLKNFTLRNLSIDLNPRGYGGQLVWVNASENKTINTSCLAIGILSFGGHGVFIDHINLTYGGVVGIDINAPGSLSRNIVITNNNFLFLRPPGSSRFDSAGVYFEGYNGTVDNNIMRYIITPPSDGNEPSSGIELHGGPAQAIGNNISGFNAGINLVAPNRWIQPNQYMLVRDNNIDDVPYGVLLWSFNVTEKPGSILKNVLIDKNIISLSKRWTVSWAAGVTVNIGPDTREWYFNNITAMNNIITFEEGDTRSLDKTYSGGVNFNAYGTVTNSTKINNTVINLPVGLY